MRVLAFSRVYPSASIHSVRVSTGASSASAGRGGSKRRNSAQQGILPIDLILARGTRRACWAVIVGVQLLLVLSLAGLALIYSQLHRRDSLLWLFSTVYLFSDATAFLNRFYVIVAASYAVFALAFAAMLAEMLFYSVRYRALAYGRRKSQSGPSSKLKSAQSPHTYGCCLPFLRRARALLASWNQKFGIRGRYFAVGLMAQEVVEIALQTSQAYASSKFVSNLALNQIYGLLICGNCMSTLLVSRWLGGDDSVFERLVCVMLDLVLDFVWGVVLPFMLLYPRLVEYFRNSDNTEFTTSAELIREEIEHLLILSTTKYVWNVFPYMSTMWNIVKLRRLLAQSMSLNASTMKLKALVQRQRTERVRKWQEQFTFAKVLPKIQHAFHRAVFVYGIIILCVSVHSTGVFRYADGTSLLCIREVYPWFASRRSCSMSRINCTEASIVGASGEIAAAMDTLNIDALTNMEVVECPELEIPAALHQFTHLRIFGVMSSRITSWSTNASVTRLPALVTLKLYHLEFAAAPDGLLVLPASVEWVSVYETDVHSFEHLIGTGWSTVKYLYCDKCGLKSVPPFVLAMRELLEFSACDNEIAAIPDAFFADRSLSIVFLDGNPLRALPSSLLQPSLFDLYLQRTEISVLPPPLSASSVKATLSVFAANSPLCTKAHEIDQDPSIAGHVTCEYQELTFG